MKPGAVLDSQALAPTQVLMGPAWVQKPARTLYAWQEPQLNVLRKRLRTLHRDWSAAWIARADSICGAEDMVIESVVAAERMGDAPGEVDWCFASGDPADPGGQNARAFDRLVEDLDQLARRALAQWMFDIKGKGAIADIARTAADSAWTDWLARLAQLIGTPLRAAPDETVVHDGMTGPCDWSGTLQIRWPWGGGQFRLVLPGEVVQALLHGEPTSSPSTTGAILSDQVSLREALHDEAVVLQVQLDGVALSLGQLQQLQLNDIVVLDHPLDAPVRILSADATLVCEGWLGQQDGRVAVELSRPPVRDSHASTAKRSAGTALS